MVSRVQASAVALAAVGLGLAYFLWIGEPPPAPAAPEARRAGSATRGASGTLPRIDLGRLESARGETKAGKRDLFNFGVPPASPTVATAPPTPPTSVAEAPAPVAAPTPAPLNVKYIGSLDRKGLRVAVFLSDKREILTGQEGEVVGNRLKIVKIGFESVDVQDVGSERTRRIPMRGN